ncbi:SDR family NAD(P)-dependent oxidoreductase [Rhizobium sp. RAF56]|uniref:SDR family NAD(P)-dependent oxidoreductase n=1 Tax=Rhizobium sp. RAF56 TaxID=3233062 RepID=UPI003F9B732D
MAKKRYHDTIATAVITGASSGIGAALARQLAASGRRLVLIGRNRERLNAVASDCRAVGADIVIGELDITDRAGLAKFIKDIETAGPIDLFVGNAGILDGRHHGEVIESVDVARHVIDTNLVAAVEAVHMVLPAMRACRQGTIVLVSSLAAFAPLADAPAYSAAKAGLLFYGIGLRDALAEEGIRVVVSCPGFVATGMAPHHIGARPHEWTADQAARHILTAMEKNRGISGFPSALYWPSRLALIVPEFLRRAGGRERRFFVKGSRAN